MRKSLINGLVLIVLNLSPLVSGCSKPSLNANNQLEVQYRESVERNRILKKDYEELKGEYDLLSKTNDENLRQMSGHKKEILMRNIREAVGTRHFAEDVVEIERLKTEIEEHNLKILKYERALKKLGLNPYEIEKQMINDKESPFELEKARMERDKMAWERDKAFYEKEISRLQKRAFELEKTQYSTPK